MSRSIEEINKIVDIVMTDNDVSNALTRRILDKNLEFLKQQRAYENGQKEQAVEIAKKMLNSNEPIDKIIEFTSLTKEEIEIIKINRNTIR